MAKKKVEKEEVVEEVVEKKEKAKEAPSFYKGYDIRWLKREPTHPEFGLVAEYEVEYGEI